jgi:hypothetical protein
VRVGKSLTRLGLRSNFVGCPGQVAEWLKAPVSKTGIPVNPVSRVRISPCPLTGAAAHVRAERAGFFVVDRLLGRVAEWFKAHAWKVCVRQKRTVGSNPTPSV